MIARVQDTIERNGGETKALEKIGRKRLAYSIRKKNNGFYVSIEFIAPGGVTNELERFYQLDENILRYLTVVVDKNVLKARHPSSVQSEESRPQVQTKSEKSAS